MIHVMAYSKEEGLKQDLSLKQLSSMNWDWYWVDFEAPTVEEVKMLDTYFNFHPLAIEDCLHDMQRPKLDYYEDHTFFVIHAIDKEELKKKEINAFLGECSIVTFHKERSEVVDTAKKLLIQEQRFEVTDEYYVLYQLLDKVVDNYFPIIYEIEDHINEIEDNTRNLSMDKLLDELFDRRGELLTLRRTVHPMRDLLYRMLNTHHLEGILKQREYFADIHDHLLKVAEMVASNREMTQDIRDSYMSLNSHQTNRTMQILTVISVIFMPLTFLAGVYGMNFQYMPELDERYGYFVVWGIMLAIAVGMYVWFKRKGWFE